MQLAGLHNFSILQKIDTNGVKIIPNTQGRKKLPNSVKEVNEAFMNQKADFTKSM